MTLRSRTCCIERFSVKYLQLGYLKFISWSILGSIRYCNAVLIFSSNPANAIIIVNPMISPMFCNNIKHRRFSDFEVMVANISGIYKQNKKEGK